MEFVYLGCENLVALGLSEARKVTRGLHECTDLCHLRLFLFKAERLAQLPLIFRGQYVEEVIVDMLDEDRHRLGHRFAVAMQERVLLIGLGAWIKV